MDRQELLDSLKLIEPALGSSKISPLLECFIFSGERVLAFNDNVAMITSCKTGEKMVIAGRMLMALLSGTKAKEVNFDTSGEAVVAKIGRSTAKFAKTISDSPAWNFVNNLQWKHTLKLPVGWMDGFRLCCERMGASAAFPWRWGVLVDDHNGCDLYASDGLIAVRSGIALIDFPHPIMLPHEFCRILSTQKSVDDLWIGNNCIQANCGKVQLMAHCPPAEPDRFTKIFDTIPEAKTTEVTPGLIRCLERAAAVVEYSSDSLTKLTVEDGHLYLDTKVASAELHDVVTFDHEPIVFYVPADAMLKAAKIATDALFTSRWAGFWSEGTTQLVCVVQND
jgi:hypothetical protein